jgi:DNA-binding MarR family transcriptional regulator
LLDTLRGTIVETVRKGGDLTARQLGVFLICYLTEEPQTVRGLAAKLHIGKPVISRTLDLLAGLDLAGRGPDPQDRRSMLVQRTRRGGAYLRELQRSMTAAATPPAAERRDACRDA